MTTCPLLAGQQAGHFLGALLSQIGNIPLPDEQLTNLANSANSCHLEQLAHHQAGPAGQTWPRLFPQVEATIKQVRP